MTINAHNHGPNEGRGVDCGEPRLADGSPIGWCQILPIIRKAKADAWDEGLLSAGLDPDYTMQIMSTNPYTEES